MRAILVCVDYADLLAVTIPYNRHHFDEVMVVTACGDTATSELCTKLGGVQVHATDAFYRDGADFNKWLALEEALDAYGRHGWLCVMDADVLWPKSLPSGFRESLQVGKLYTPLRRMFTDLSQPIPQEPYWRRYPIHRNVAEWAGYSQIFHATDPALGSAPWHETNWRHAGGADSFFQLKWKPADKVRPAFEVLHLGEAGVNWCGRSSRYLDGSEPEQAGERQRKVRTYISSRRTGIGRFDREKLR